MLSVFPASSLQMSQKKKCTAGEKNLTLISNRRNKSGSSNTELSLGKRIKGHDLATWFGSTKADVGAM